MIVGNDISAYQGDIAWDVYKNNSNFVIIKATEGTGITDSKLSKNQFACRGVGLPLGYYHFAHPELGNTPEAEADYFLSKVGNPVAGEVYCLDYEASWNGGVVNWCKAFMDRVNEKIGVKCFIYLNQSLIRNYDWSPVINNNYPLWIAAYTGSPTNTNYFLGQWPEATMHQWTNAETVPGISGKVDGDSFNGDGDTFKKYGYQAPIPQPPPTPPPVPPPDCDQAIAQAVSDNDKIWQSKMDIANKLIDDLKNQNLGSLPWQTLLSWGWKNFWKARG